MRFFKTICIFSLCSSPLCAQEAVPAVVAAAQPLVAAVQEQSITVQVPTPAIQAYGSEYYQKFITAAWMEQNGQKPLAIKEYIELNEITPKQVPILKSIVNIAIEQEDMKTMDTYVPILMDIAPKEADTLSIYATWLWSRGELKEALNYYQQSLAMDSYNPFTMFKYITLLSTVDPDAAISYMENIRLDFPKVAGTLALQIADLYLEAKDPVKAIAYLNEATKQSPDLMEPYLGRAKIYEQQGDTQSVLKEYLALEKVGLANVDILTKIGAYYILENKKNIATEYFLKAKALRVDAPLPAQFLAIRAEEQGNYAAAINYLLESSDYQTNPAYQVRVSYLYNKQGNLADAAANLQQAYKNFPGNTEVSYYYALALTDIGDYKGAGKIFEEVLKIVPDNASALLQYALVLERQKEYKAMQKQLRKLLQVTPDNADALNFLGYHLIDKTKNIEEGGELIKRALALNPQDAAFIDSMGWYYYKKGNYQNALTLIEEAATTIETDPEVLLHMALVSNALGNHQSAADYYRKLLVLDANNKTATKGLKRAIKGGAK